MAQRHEQTSTTPPAQYPRNDIWTHTTASPSTPGGPVHRQSTSTEAVQRCSKIACAELEDTSASRGQRGAAKHKPSCVLSPAATEECTVFPRAWPRAAEHAGTWIAPGWDAWEAWAGWDREACWWMLRVELEDLADGTHKAIIAARRRFRVMITRRASLRAKRERSNRFGSQYTSRPVWPIADMKCSGAEHHGAEMGMSLRAGAPGREEILTPRDGVTTLTENFRPRHAWRRRDRERRLMAVMRNARCGSEIEATLRQPRGNRYRTRRIAARSAAWWGTTYEEEVYGYQREKLVRKLTASRSCTGIIAIHEMQQCRRMRTCGIVDCSTAAQQSYDISHQTTDSVSTDPKQSNVLEWRHTIISVVRRRPYMGKLRRGTGSPAEERICTVPAETICSVRRGGGTEDRERSARSWAFALVEAAASSAGRALEAVRCGAVTEPRPVEANRDTGV
ncbi:hypothetical protein OBBRIDRAFT_802154 [Obba rivulosa]|uniref:Uncharacterized protein n=1 Tax=Obba rivulosa TaxID=1052685 RepID=A0A8E2AXZ8_9APHY|nr:hypothetical protein OBBRIDRAFT_802154 [Obba rivulosa]